MEETRDARDDWPENTAEVGVCISCGKTRLVQMLQDPYEYEVNGNTDTPFVPWCRPCYQDALEGS